MGDIITKYCRLSLGGHKPRISPEICEFQNSDDVLVFVGNWCIIWPIQYVVLVAITGTAVLVPYLKLSLCNSFEDQAPVNFIYRCPVFKWVTETLTNCGLVTICRHRSGSTLVEVGNGLLPDGTKPLPEPMLTDHQWSPVTFILVIRAISQEMPQPSITEIHLKMTYLKFHSNFPQANELTAW